MSTPHKCPCCDGWGIRKVADGFKWTELKCSACHGTGVIWEHDLSLKLSAMSISDAPVNQYNCETNFAKIEPLKQNKEIT